MTKDKLNDRTDGDDDEAINSAIAAEGVFVRNSGFSTPSLERNLNRLLIVASAAALLGGAGCVPVAADGAFQAQGEVEGFASCELQLFEVDGRDPLQRVTVSGVFRETFVVSARPHTYRLAVVCGGTVRQSVWVRYGETVVYEKPINLGKVAL